MEKIKVILFGYGNTGKLIARYVAEHGGEVCAIVDTDPQLSGSRVGNAVINGDANAALNGAKADIAVIATGGGLAQIAPIAEKCLSRGVNVITTSEESIFPYSTSPALTASLDRLAEATFAP